MENVISIYRKQPIIDQLISELKYALKDMTTEELTSIFLAASGIALKTTVKTKITSIRNVFQLARQTAERYQKEGIYQSAKDDINKLSKLAMNLPQKAKSLYESFIKLPKDKKIEAVISAILISSIYFACCGGMDLEGGLPDMDITIAGIGHHRSIFSHSILLGLGIEFSGRMTILVLENIYGRLPQCHHKIWDNVFDFIQKNKNLAIGAMWLGIGTHLIKDSGIITGGVKPYSDVPFSMSKEMHQVTFAVNGISSGSFAKSSLNW